VVKRLENQRHEFQEARARVLRREAPPPPRVSEGSTVEEWKDALQQLAADAKRHTDFLASELEHLGGLPTAEKKGVSGAGAVFTVLEQALLDAKLHAQYVAEQCEALVRVQEPHVLSGPVRVDEAVPHGPVQGAQML